jgi:triosephosphate isomerase
LTKLKTPVIVVNFKTYAEVEGQNALDLALICQEISREAGVSIAVCPPMVELSRIASQVKIPVFGQHIDAKVTGASTGWVTPGAVRATGAIGTLLNHSEHRLMMYDVSAINKSCHEAGLETIICADGPDTANIVASFGPDFIAVEPPELIGGDVSVTDARPEVISEAVESVHRVDAHIPVLCGAGIKNGKDVKKALQLGAKGVLLASGVVRAKDVRATLRDLIGQI